MSCCSEGTAALNGRHRMRVRYGGGRPVLVKGPVTGHDYHFSGSARLQLVDPRDAVGTRDVGRLAVDLAPDEPHDRLRGLVPRPHQREMQEDDRWLVRAWVVLFVVMFFNASVSGMIRVHLAVIPLTIVALLHIRRACRIEQLAA